MSKYTFKINGMHCASCELWLESAIRKIAGVSEVDAKLGTNQVDIVMVNDLPENEVLALVQKAISSRSSEYSVELVTSTESTTFDSTNSSESWKNYLIAFVIAFVFLGSFLLLQSSSLLNAPLWDVNLPYIFLIGLIASLSTCAATVGALVLSLSSSYAKAGKKSIYAISNFHIGRLVAFFVFGGLLGILGNFIAFNYQVEISLRVLIQIFILLLGLNLLGVSLANSFQLRLPKSMSRKTFVWVEKTHFVIPFLLGALTFLLPCGFTQSVQLLALESKSFWNGSLTMLVFALGTLPVLLGISLISTNVSANRNSKAKDLFFKTAGFITVFMALYGMYLLKNLF